MSTNADKCPMDQPTYTSPIDAEPLHRYRQGGYHPVTLGECLKAGRYKVSHKLGWGGYSTVWAATETYVAVKVCVAEREHDRETRELQTMKELASHLPSPTHVVQLLDDFGLMGPNGFHKCLVYELLGPNIPDVVDAHFSGGRLPGKLAKIIAKQSLSGLNDLHQRNIGHGGKPEIGRVQRHDGKDLELGMPEYIVKPTSYRIRSWNSIRAPEVLFQDQIDYHVDLWSMGCMLFELFTGQPPFDTFLITPPILIGQMQEMASDDLPQRWQEIWNTMNKGDDVTAESSGPNLQEWLEEVYFDGRRTPDLTRGDITRLGEIIGSLLCFEPSARASARQILDDPWFNE
ncbi:hypothetical protein N7471_010370 [Penicillium samsonianum]|uniref:uncharacterized protein n=1 Tax=Penicillium samsonianum TaxID=1882272 RepID=UPI002547BA29|nr:uncharacterized protein N7471_010370 [Penicillium samsonianum]KAJ6125877.1 hypothetical protein N7471_010370 [Penicillium samsonianum]